MFTEPVARCSCRRERLASELAGQERDHGVQVHFPFPQSEAPSKVLASTPVPTGGDLHASWPPPLKLQPFLASLLFFNVAFLFPPLRCPFLVLFPEAVRSFVLFTPLKVAIRSPSQPPHNSALRGVLDCACIQPAPAATTTPYYLDITFTIFE